MDNTEFVERLISHSPFELEQMLAAIGAKSLEGLISETIPADILQNPNRQTKIPQALSEHSALAKLKGYAQKNKVNKSLIGLGYYNTITPTVILRNLLENPGWYTPYTPYQAEIAQGRLEALLNYQQMIINITGLDIANASLLDEATSAAEAMAMAKRVSQSQANSFFVDENCFPQTIDVIKTRAEFYGFNLIIDSIDKAPNHEVFGAILQNPNQRGEFSDLTSLISSLKAKGSIVVVATDLMASVLLKSAGSMGADIAIGSSQRFGVPMSYGGPHAAFLACRDEYKRSIPGRIIGVTIDTRGKRAYRMTMQTREQHIRREKANSNICTSQVLLANIAGMYALYHGEVGLKKIATRIHLFTNLLAQALQSAGVEVYTKNYFDTVLFSTAKLANCEVSGFNLRVVNKDTLGISFDETTTLDDIVELITTLTTKKTKRADLEEDVTKLSSLLDKGLFRQDRVFNHPVFSLYHSEHAMLRYLKRLQSKDLALDHSMIPLGSCTMKLNPTSAMIPITWEGFANIHPFAPKSQTAGYQQLLTELKTWLGELTGFPHISLQPNSGASGEYAGIVAIRRYQMAKGDVARNICLIPKSAHGTNPATAQMCGLQVVVVDCDAKGNVDINSLQEKITQHKGKISCLMLTYPSTHGVFETAVRKICELVHIEGAQVYMDGANLNAQVGYTAPGFIGADVSHMNLHKTFAIPHGGGGPGMGPIGLQEHLIPFVSEHIFAESVNKNSAVSAAPYGSAGILPITWMYISMLGLSGLKLATATAIVNANYVASRLNPHYPVLYTGVNGRVAHECILDVRGIKSSLGISEIDIAKRLIDYGFHAPTVSFPVVGTLMVEPTESESKAELDRFCDALISIRGEITKIEKGEWSKENNPLKNAPHTVADLLGEWKYPYDKDFAVYPLPFVRENKFWVTVNRIDDSYGDRNVFCSCPPMEEY